MVSIYHSIDIKISWYINFIEGIHFKTYPKTITCLFAVHSKLKGRSEWGTYIWRGSTVYLIQDRSIHQYIAIHHSAYQYSKTQYHCSSTHIHTLLPPSSPHFPSSHTYLQSQARVWASPRSPHTGTLPCPPAAHSAPAGSRSRWPHTCQMIEAVWSWTPMWQGCQAADCHCTPVPCSGAAGPGLMWSFQLSRSTRSPYTHKCCEI